MTAAKDAPDAPEALAWLDPALLVRLAVRFVLQAVGLMAFLLTYHAYSIRLRLAETGPMVLGCALLAAAGALAGLCEAWARARGRTGAALALAALLVTACVVFGRHVVIPYAAAVLDGRALAAARTEVIGGLGDVASFPLFVLAWGLRSASTLLALVAARLRGLSTPGQLLAVALAEGIGGALHWRYVCWFHQLEPAMDISLTALLAGGTAVVLVLTWRAGDALADRWSRRADVVEGGPSRP